MKLTAPPRYLLGVVLLLLGAIVSWAAFQAAQTRPVAPASMAAMLPQGALLTIESPDFAGLLHRWNASPEQKAWLASDNYSVFSNSRLFGRLNDARAEFEAAAKSSPAGDSAIDGDFLTQVAGRQSIFAWYDVGNLEFLYITRIDSAHAANIALLKDRASWSARQSAGTTFYIRKSSSTGPAAAAQEQGESAQGKARTFAFAQGFDPAGDLLILATREDLIANALTLVRPAPALPPASLATEAWYTEVSAALPLANPAPALHMVLNLDRLVPQPYFRSYWVQRNISEMKQYRAAVSDLYTDARQFREERALLPAAPEAETSQADLSSLAALVPSNGVFTAAATSDADEAVTAITEKLLGRAALQALPPAEAADPSLDAPQSGSATDLETRIDAPAPVTAAVSNRALAQAAGSAGLDAVLTYSAAQPPAAPAGLWVPIHSAVVLHAASPWNSQALQSALQQSLRGSLTAATLGIEFLADSANGQTIYSLTGPKPLLFAVIGNLCVLADDRTLLLSLLQQAATPRAVAPAVPRATRIAGFDHTGQRAPYARLTALIDGTNQRLSAPASSAAEHIQPAFFSGNLRSLSDAFAALASEHFTERRDGAILRQTVTYHWQTP